MSSLELSAGALQLSLIDAYIIDLQDTFAQVLGPGTTFIGPPRCCALLGGEIVIQIDQLPAGVAFNDAADKFDQIAQCSKFIISSWSQDDSLHAKVSPDPWKSTRVDRYSGSRIHDMGSNQAISSIDRLQKLKIVQCDNELDVSIESTGVVDTAMNHTCSSIFDTEARFEEYQTMSLHLMASLRLSSTDVSTVLHLLAEQGLSWEQLRGESGIAPSYRRPTDSKYTGLRDPSSVVPNGNVMICHAIDALIQPSVSGAQNQLVPAHIMPRYLKELQTMDGMSAVRKSMANKYVVIFHVHRRAFHEASRALGQSYFVQFEENTQFCQDQVHILETQLAGLANCHVLSFTQMPTDEIVDTAINEILGLFDVPEARISRIKPVLLSRALFRADGLTDRLVLDSFATLMKAVLQKNRGSKVGINLELCSSPLPMREPNTYVVFTRQSSEESGALSNTSIPRQATSLFTSPESPIRDLQPQDKIIVVVEVCSSHKHPLQDRTIFQKLPHTENLVFLTANVDRLTRRKDEVEQILSKGKWFSTGFHNSRTEWVDVKENLEQVKEHLSLRRQRAFQSTHYSLSVYAMVRLLDTAEREFVPEIQTIRTRIKQMFADHYLDRILLCVRVSPNTKLSAQNDKNTSLIRQQKFLETMIPNDLNRYTEVLRASKVSASTSDFSSLLSKRLQEIDEPTLVLSVSADRMSRSVEDIAIFTDMSRSKNHVFASFIWDSDTPIDVDDPLKSQERSRGKSAKLPKIIPIVWSPCEDNMQQHVHRQFENAEQWVQAVSHTSFQGEAREVPAELATTTGRLLDRNHLTEWHEYLNENSPVDVTIVANAYEHRVQCSCDGCAADCVCVCVKCEHERRCPCVAVCSCPAICDCRCKICHKTETQLKGNKAKVPENYTNLDRKCVTTGCQNLAPSNTQYGLFCKGCFVKSRSAERVCWTIGCSNPAPFKGPTGKACVECSNTNPDPVSAISPLLSQCRKKLRIGWASTESELVNQSQQPLSGPIQLFENPSALRQVSMPTCNDFQTDCAEL